MKQPLPPQMPPWQGAFQKLREWNNWYSSRVSIYNGTGVIFVQVLKPGVAASSAQAELPPDQWHRVPDAIDALALYLLENGAEECNRGPKGEIPDQTYGLPIPAEPVRTENGRRVGPLFG